MCVGLSIGLFLILIKFINFNYTVKCPPQKKCSIFFCISNHVIIWNKLKPVLFVKADGMYKINGNSKVNTGLGWYEGNCL